MKKTLSLLCAACIAVGMQAQTYMVNDFESGLNGANAAWGGTAELIDNPCSSSDNSSTKVLKVVSTEFANVAIPLNLPEGKTLADYTGVRLQLAVLEGSENITWVGNELGLVDNDTQEKTFQVAQNSWGDATYNTWMSLDFNFDETILATYLDGNHASTSLLINNINTFGYFYRMTTARQHLRRNDSSIYTIHSHLHIFLQIYIDTTIGSVNFHIIGYHLRNSTSRRAGDQDQIVIQIR